MKYPVEEEILKKYLPEDEFVKITEEYAAKRENHRIYMQKLRENHRDNCENHRSGNGENEPKTAILAENPVNFTRAMGGKGGFLFNYSTNTPNDTLTYSSVRIKKEKINKKEKFSEEFEAFWSAWPRHIYKINKEGAKQAFCRAFKANKGLTLETLLKAIEWWKNSKRWQNDNGKYIPKPSKWLKECEWQVLENITIEKPPEKIIEQTPEPPRQVLPKEEVMRRMRIFSKQQYPGKYWYYDDDGNDIREKKDSEASG
jgi:hypothetical protein